MSQLQEILLDMAKETPLFNYQFESFSTFPFEILNHLCKGINEVLLCHSPGSNAVYMFYNSLFANSPPPLKVFEPSPGPENVSSYTKCLWRHASQFSSQTVADAVWKSMGVVKDLSDTESLYYLTSCIEDPNTIVAAQELKLSNYYLSICYNLQKTPKEPLERIMENLEISLLYGEVLIKTIIMLCRLNEFSLIDKATFNLGYKSRTDPEISEELMKKLIESLTASLYTKVDFYALSTFFIQNAEKISDSQFISLFNYMKDNWNEVNPLFSSKVEKIMDYGQLNQILMIQTSEISRKKIIDLQKKFEISPQNKLILEIMAKHKVYIHSILVKYINLFNKIKKDQDLLAIVSYILEILSFSTNSRDIVEKVALAIEKFKLWDKLTVKDSTNLYFLLIHTSISGFSVPETFNRNFISLIFRQDAYEEKILNTSNGLMFYKAFKYCTELEPRFLVSNDPSFNKKPQQIHFLPDLPPDELLKLVKLNAVFNSKALEPPPECRSALETFYRQRDSDLSLKNLKKEVIETIDSASNSQYQSANMKENVNDKKTGWKIDISKITPTKHILLLSEGDFYCTETGEESINLLQQTIQKQLSLSTSHTILQISSKHWNSLTPESKKSLIDSILIDNR